MKTSIKILLSAISGLLLAAAWPEQGFPFLLFFAFVPLLVVEHFQWTTRESNHASAFIPYIVITFFIWVASTTWWVYNSTPIGIVATLLVNTSLVGGAFFLFHVSRRQFSSNVLSYLALIAYVLTAEYIHLRWDLNFPWLNLGNGFAAYPKWIQWYEYTGIFGGSLWILLINILILFYLLDVSGPKRNVKKMVMGIIPTLLLIMIPLLLSLNIYNSYKEKVVPVEIVVVQPNIDPYNEQYELDPLVVTERMLGQASALCDTNTQLTVFPESALQEYVFEDNFNSAGSIFRIRTFLKDYPNMKVLTGISSRKIFNEGEPLSKTARKFRDTTIYYDSYNTALLLSSDSSIQKYHKSKLTPGVEQMPFIKYLPFIEKLAIDLGGTVGSLGVDEEQKPMIVNENIKAAPVICYESVYGEFYNRFVRNGANIICIITNDGWWGNTPGHRQHMLFASIRAIETRRSIARSANTGISCFINQRGDISQRTPYWEPAAIKGTLNANEYLTFYVRYGDYIGRIFLLIAILASLLTLSKGVVGNKTRTLKH